MTVVMEDEDDRRLLDIIGDVQALNAYLHGTSRKAIDEEDLDRTTFSSASSLFASTTSTTLKDVTKHLGSPGVEGLPLSNSLHFLEEDGSSPGTETELGEEQPFDILQKSLQEANITEQTLAQEAFLESSSGLSPGHLFATQVANDTSNLGNMGLSQFPPFSGVQSHNNNPSGPIQLLGSFNTQPSVMTINHLDRSQILLKHGQSSSPNVGSGLFVQRQANSANLGSGNIFNNSLSGHMSLPFKGCEMQTALPLQNIIIQRTPSQPLGNQKGPINIQPKPMVDGRHAVYSVNSVGVQQQSNPFVPVSSSQMDQQQMTVSIINQPGMSKIVHPGGIASSIHQHPSCLPHNQFLLPTSRPITSSNANQGMQTLNGQAGQSQAIVNSSEPSAQVASNTPYSESIFPQHGTPVQLIAGQNLMSPRGQFIVHQQVSPAVVHLAAPQPDMSKVRANVPLGTIHGMQIQNQFAVVQSNSPIPSSYETQSQPSVQGFNSQQILLSQGQVQPQCPPSVGHQFLIPLGSNQQQDNSSLQQQQFGQNQVTLEAQVQTSPGLSSKPQEPRQGHMANLLNKKVLKSSGGPTPLVENGPPNKVAGHSILQHGVRASAAKKRQASHQLTKSTFILEQLQKDQASVQTADRDHFSSLDDAIRRLLPYHVFQGSLPSEEEFTKVDEEFEAVAKQVLLRTKAMLNKYRWLLLEEAKRLNPSSEMVMIDRTFNQEERANLTRDKRLALMDPDGFLEDFCCLTQTKKEEPVSSCSKDDPHLEQKNVSTPTETFRTISLSKELPASTSEKEAPISGHMQTAIGSILEHKNSQNCMSPGQTHAVGHTDSALEAAVNSILDP
ncbi:BRD4-interacting chromatin-remodeling complex-associated protein-like isoform X2 [Erpetoichthys calabaricus]|uniref:BICRA like chromatin remodeling complex associated protein n=1 Tax=Erpetoichthys calabaricus TaxID=27687 RepID=A0A8C4STL9_ERPCA|nr:BRD4-interacting chromatin-remodeling complex-associated protein-like isoform X2 [Erpetoichthys calabaricus]